MGRFLVTRIFHLFLNQCMFWLQETLDELVNMSGTEFEMATNFDEQVPSGYSPTSCPI